MDFATIHSTNIEPTNLQKEVPPFGLFVPLFCRGGKSSRGSYIVFSPPAPLKSGCPNLDDERPQVDHGGIKIYIHPTMVSGVTEPQKMATCIQWLVANCNERNRKAPQWPGERRPGPGTGPLIPRSNTHPVGQKNILSK